MPQRVKIVVVDDHPIVRAGVRAVLEIDTGLEVVGEASTSAEALERCGALRPAIAVVDWRLRGEDGGETVRALISASPSTRAIMLSSYGGDEVIHRAFDAGARGYLLKDTAPETLAKAINAVVAGRRYIPAEVAARLAAHGPRVALTGRETQVLALMADGLRNKEIAAALNMSEATARTHVQNILSKFDCTDRGRAIAVGIARGFLSPETGGYAGAV